MSSQPIRKVTSQKILRLMPFAIFIVILACTLPGFPLANKPATIAPTSVPTVSSPPTATPKPLPPALVESDPPPGSEIPLAQPITLYFNQSMDKASVEGAVSGQPQLSGKFKWKNDAQLTFVPDSPFLPETKLTLTIGTAARSKKGLALLNPQSLSFQTAGYLRLSQMLPADGSQDVDPTSAVVANFNRSVVALASEPANQPTAFTITAEDGSHPQGRAEWLNTSTYIFYPQPGLAGGQTYTVTVNPDLVSIEGSPLQTETDQTSWTFSTSSPRLNSMEPESGLVQVALDRKISLVFNQVMDQASVAANFILQEVGGQSVTGEFSWSEDGKTATYTPGVLLKRNTTYTAILQGTAQGMGGTMLGVDSRSDFTTVGTLQVSSSNPPPGGTLGNYQPLNLTFSSYLPANNPDRDWTQSITITPTVTGLQSYLDPDQQTLHIYGNFQPLQNYQLSLAPDLKDQWGSSLSSGYSLNFQAGPLEPSLNPVAGFDVFFLTPQDTGISSLASNLASLPTSVGSVPLDDFLVMLSSNGYDIRQTYQPADQQIWTQQLGVPADQRQYVQLSVNPQGTGNKPGLYLMRWYSNNRSVYPGPYLFVVSNIQITFKLSFTDALVWAVDLRTHQPLSAAPVKIYDENGNVLASGTTDTDGAFASSISLIKDPYIARYVVVGEPGGDTFGLAQSTWNAGIDPANFGLATSFVPVDQKIYLYTDRPIYRPGQTVYFRAVVRQDSNTRYTLPNIGNLNLPLYNEQGEVISTFDLSLSAFGTAHGQFDLPPEAQPGNYRLGDDPNSLYFQVADYRKPEVNLQVTFQDAQALAGQDLTATVDARYFFDAPVSNAPIHWTLYARPSAYVLPDYQVGPIDSGWLRTTPLRGVTELGIQVADGEAQTGPDGKLVLTLPTQTGVTERQTYLVEVTLTDESGLPVSARAKMDVNPAVIYIGIRPDQWTGQSGQPVFYTVRVAGWAGSPAGEHSLRAEFRKVEWVRQEPKPGDIYSDLQYVPQYTPVASTDFVTGKDGLARLEYTPPEPGTYQLDVAGEGALTQVLIWVSGPGQVGWPNLPNQKLQLTADRATYQPGDIANIFIPNPYSQSVIALVTVERDIIMRHQVITVDGNGLSLSLPLVEDDAPNVYVSVTLIGQTADGKPDFRQGYTELKVSPAKHVLNVSLTSQPDRAGPGDEVTFNIRVTDAGGKPVQGEFSLAVVDLAALSLADPNAPDIDQAFYGEQPLTVRTGISLAAYAGRSFNAPGGMGGGGEASPTITRENFPDTAYWNASIMTGENGMAQVSFKLPDNLTTWQVDLRGVTGDTRVGQAQLQLVTTKELLVRPVTPRFLVVGDHALLAAVVQNNTGQARQVRVTLQAPGFTLDEPDQAEQDVNIASGGRARVEWWGVAQDASVIDPVFTASAGDLIDAAKPSSGSLPVLHNLAPQTFATTGVLDQAGERVELISLPPSFQPQGGQLRLDLSPSLASAILKSLDVLENNPYDNTELILSHFLANLETYQALQKFGLSAPDLQDRLDHALRQDLARLASRQGSDGGWAWWSSKAGDPSLQSDPYLTAYVLFGLGQARQAGAQVNDQVLQNGLGFLMAGLPTPQMTSQPWQLDRLTFEAYVLATLGNTDPGLAEAIYAEHQQLSPWAQALLALTLVQVDQNDPRIQTLLSDLQSGAIRSATGAHWEDTNPEGQNSITPVTATAIVVYALAQREPASTILPDAIHYLMAQRQGDGAWSSTYETAWTILALTEAMQGTGDIGSDYAFGANLNGTPIATGQGTMNGASPVSASISLQDLYPTSPNELVISRQAGSGRLYYSIDLQVDRPVANSPAYQGGIQVTRDYFLSGKDCQATECTPISSASIGQMVTARLTLVLSHDMYHLAVEDYIPAGTEILDKSLKTSQQGVPEGSGVPTFDPRNPFSEGWGWWLFQAPQIYADHLTWSADYLPAGTYQLTYTLVPAQPGQYGVIPAHAWEYYFPEVQGTSAGTEFDISK